MTKQLPFVFDWDEFTTLVNYGLPRVDGVKGKFTVLPDEQQTKQDVFLFEINYPGVMTTHSGFGIRGMSIAAAVKKNKELFLANCYLSKLRDDYLADEDLRPVAYGNFVIDETKFMARIIKQTLDEVKGKKEK